MISVMDYVPSGLKRYIKLWLIRRKYPDCTIYSPFIGARVELGRGCVVAEGAQINDGVSLGDYTYVNSGTIIFSGTIGRFCSIAYNCQIGPAEHPVNYLSTSPWTYGKDNLLGLGPLWGDYTSPPIIENDVWIGSNAIVLQGVHIGNGAIVAAGTVVNRDVPPYAIVGGVPAKLIRLRFSEEMIDYLQGLRWWDLPIEELESLRTLFAAKGEWTLVVRSMMKSTFGS